MILNEKFIPVRNLFYELVSNSFQSLAKFFGYPENPGMPTQLPEDLIRQLNPESQYYLKLPIHKTAWPPVQRPETIFEMIFGPTPKLDRITKYFYESKEEGFYNFYVENYRNSYFLPDWLSEFFQLKLNICLDLRVLETSREVVFVGLMVYSQIVILRIALAWFLSINPYKFPWCYVAAATDWTEDVLQGVVPAVLGINFTATFFLGILGVLADSLNHLVFTMPYLPSEGEPSKVFINNKEKDVLVFHYLPRLWYSEIIPNEIREFWLRERPEILGYFITEYSDIKDKFLPNSMLREALHSHFPNSLNSLF